MTSGSPVASLHLTTSDVGEAEDVLRQVGAPARISLAAGVSDEGFRFDIAGQGDEEVTFASFSVEGHWSVKTELDVYVLAICLDGALGWCSGAQSGVLAGEAVLLPAGFSELEVDGSARVFEVQFTAAALLRFARQFYDVEYMHLRIEAGVARSHAHRAMTAAALQYARAFTSSGAIGDPQLLASLKANLEATLLSGFRVTGPRREWRLSDPAERKAFQRAAELIETNAHRPISVLDVAGHTALPLNGGIVRNGRHFGSRRCPARSFHSCLSPGHGTRSGVPQSTCSSRDPCALVIVTSDSWLRMRGCARQP